MIRADRFGRLLLAGVASLAIATPSWAQTAEQTTAEANQQPPAPDATGATNDEGQDTATTDVIVTARRTDERIQRVPSSISAFNERALDRIQATDTTGLQGAVPNLNIVQGRGSSNATNIFIRGIGQPDALQTFDPAVGVYVDDVYLSRIRGNQLDLLDVERIEVLRGPQGTLYGKNTIGGAIKFVSRKPGDELRAEGSASVGSYKQFDLRGNISGPIANGVAVGVSIMRSTHDGYVEDRLDDREYNDRDSFGARGAVAFTPSDRIRIDLTADYSRDDAALSVGRPVNNLTTFSGGTLVVTDPVGSGKYNWKGETTPGLPNSTKLKHYGFAGTAAFDVTDNVTLKSITAYRNLKTDDYIDIDATHYEVGDVFVGVDQHQFSQEFQLAYTSDRFNGVAGLYYLNENVDSHQEAYADDLLGPLFLNSGFLRTIDDKLNTKSYAGYANGSYEIVPNVRLSAGVRFTKETKDYWRTTSTFFSLLPAFNSTYVFAPPKGKWNDTSPMVSLDWQATPDTMVYARVAKGFKSGGFNGRANTPGESTKYDPETVWSYEAGFKTTVAKQLRLNGAIFYNDYKDFQARVSGLDTDPVTGLPAPKLSVLNAGKMNIKGAELEASWTPIQNLLIDSQIGYLDAEYKEFDDVRFTAFNGSRAFQTPAFAPKWTVRFGTQYTFDLGGSGGITLGGQTRYRSKQALAVDNTFVNTDTKIEGLFQDGYWVEDARVAWENETKKLSLGLYANNLTDKAYKTDGQEFSSVGNIRTVYYGNPRTFTLKFTARY
ncbi:TonB-dependent receptor [Sphingomonas sp. SM33]|uniref:TonB-dependent receptor n=1 Tax=Sphingomonas telluris TaxID=2907998 RepID=A0ABS9VP96_9SPHN|nr:TonB-dependent receptor [Sphingomonas telluris]MCH8616798.1 TonB-dependent receptor [Sphingomonas telluris]